MKSVDLGERQPLLEIEQIRETQGAGIICDDLELSRTIPISLFLLEMRVDFGLLMS